MAVLASVWARVHPYVRVAVAAVTGAVVIVGAPIVFADVTAMATGGTVNWPERAVLLRTFGAAALVVGTAYWAHSPKGRDVWTEEQRAGMKDLKDGKL